METPTRFDIDAKAGLDMKVGPGVCSESTHIKPQCRKPHDPAVKFEEYHYYANRTREQEEGYEPPSMEWRQLVFGKKGDGDDDSSDSNEEQLAHLEHRLEITDKEWDNAGRALRTASAGACFYLITADVLGPHGVAFTLGTLGWGPGIAIFTAFGLLAGYSGYLIWRVFMGVDSNQFPAKNYGDIGFRTWGAPMRHLTNILQALGLVLILGQCTIMNGQNISQISQFKLCYVVCPVLFVCAGFILTQIRTLRAYGIIANLCVWLTVLVIIIVMGVVAHSPPNYAIATLGSAGSAVDPSTITKLPNGTYPPIMHYTKLPAGKLVGSINGMMSGVLAFSGVQLFVEFLAEMKRPRDFLKAMCGAQVLLYTIYLVYGCFVYHYQGQYSFQPAYQGLSSYAWQTVGNSITLITGLIGAGLYANIGVKVMYNNVLIDIFNAPPMITRHGKMIYAAMVPVFWTVAFLIAASIPDYFGYISVMAATCLLNLVYTLPPLLALGFDVQRHAGRDGEGFDPNTGVVLRKTLGMKRLVRGFMGGGALQVSVNVWHVIYFLSAIIMSVLGTYAAIDGMIEAFKQPQLNSFSCTSPLDLSAKS